MRYIETVKDMRLALKGVNSNVPVTSLKGLGNVEIEITLTGDGQQVLIGQPEPKKDKS
jgi:hypothetical protein